MPWQELTLSHYEGQGGEEGGEVRARGAGISSPFVYARGGKRPTVFWWLGDHSSGSTGPVA